MFMRETNPFRHFRF